MKNKINTYCIDLFCGAGGTTSSISGISNMKVVWAINHDTNAINSHHANHPDCIHSMEDIRTFDIAPLKELIDVLRLADPTCVILLHASLECTNFSRAKCGPKDADSRTLAEDLLRYLDVLDVDILTIENVMEFMKWGPLDDNGNPMKQHEGAYYEAWCKTLQEQYFSEGYYEGVLNSADYGGRTIRKRLFLQFSKNQKHIGTPVQTHSKDGGEGLEKWLPVKDILDLDNHGNSIFTRKKNLVWKTHQNIYKGLTKYGPAEGINFGYTYYGNSGFVDVESPCATLTTKDRVALVGITPLCVSHQYGNASTKSVEEPLGTLTTAPKADIIILKGATFMVNPQYGGSTKSVEDPAATVIARQDKAPLSVANAPEHQFPTELRTSTLTEQRDHIRYEDGKIVYTLFADDDEWFRKIKVYMFENSILDICVRPLTVIEMLQIQGFDPEYKLVGTKTEHKKYIGNSVEVKVGTAFFVGIDTTIQIDWNSSAI